MSDGPRLLLLSDSSARVEHWRGLLADTDCDISTQADLASSCPPVVVVITDEEQLLEDPKVAYALSDIYAVIAIGADLVADVVLTADPTRRELQLACQLLSEIVYLRRDQVASQQTQQRLSELAEVDSLTGLANRRAWDIELQRRISHSDEGDGTLCLMLLDLDHFKAINTTHGYTVADEILQHVGITLRTSVRTNDFAARIGGDEFAVLLPNISPEHAEAVVERIRTGALNDAGKDGDFKVTATAGLAVRQATDDAESLFSRADTHLRRGKAMGRNRTVASIERTDF